MAHFSQGGRFLIYPRIKDRAKVRKPMSFVHDCFERENKNRKCVKRARNPTLKQTPVLGLNKIQFPRRHIQGNLNYNRIFKRCRRRGAGAGRNCETL